MTEDRLKRHRIALALILLLLGVLLLTVFNWLWTITTPPSPLFPFFVNLVGLLYSVSGYCLYKDIFSARVLPTLSAVLLFFSFPIGTAFSAYYAWFYVQRKNTET